MNPPLKWAAPGWPSATGKLAVGKSRVVRARCASRLHIQFLGFLRRCPVRKLRPGKALSKLSRRTGPCRDALMVDFARPIADALAGRCGRQTDGATVSKR